MREELTNPKKTGFNYSRFFDSFEPKLFFGSFSEEKTVSFTMYSIQNSKDEPRNENLWALRTAIILGRVCSISSTKK